MGKVRAVGTATCRPIDEGQGCGKIASPCQLMSIITDAEAEASSRRSGDTAAEEDC